MAEGMNHSQIEAIHLLAALVEQRDGVVPQILNRIGVNGGTLEHVIQAELKKLTRAFGKTTQTNVSRELTNVVRAAEREASQMNDEFVSTEHLFLALVDTAGQIRSLGVLKSAGVSRDDVLRALTGIRGGQRVTSQNPETTYEALAK